MKEQKNLFLAIGISIGIIVFFQLLFPTQPFEQPTTQNNTSDSEVLDPATSIDNKTSASIDIVKPKEEVLIKSERILIENSSLSGSINLTGAILDDLNLLEYKDSLEENSKNIELLLPDETSNPYYIEFGWKEFNGNTIQVPDLNTKWKSNSSKLTPTNPVTLQWTNDSNITFLINFSIDKNYMFSIKQEVINNSSSNIEVYPYRLIKRIRYSTENLVLLIITVFTLFLLFETFFREFPRFMPYPNKWNYIHHYEDLSRLFRGLPPRSSAIPKIVAIGDSFTRGAEVAPHKDWVSILNKNYGYKIFN